MERNNDYTAENLLDYEYLTAIDLSKQTKKENPDLTLFRMDFFRPTHGLGGEALPS